MVCTKLNTNGTKENDSVLSESCTAFLLPLSVGLHLFPVYFCMAFVKVYVLAIPFLCFLLQLVDVKFSFVEIAIRLGTLSLM